MATTYTPDYLQPGGTVTGAPTGATYQALNPDELASTQLQGLMAQNGQYIQNARAQGEQFAESHGLLNSSMAAGASENSAISAAAPIAMANAQEVSQIGAANQQAANQYTGEQIAAHAQTNSASIAASGQMGSARIYSEAQLKAAQMSKELQELSLKQQYDEFGISSKDQVDEFNAQQKNAMAQFETSQNNQIGQFQASMDWNKYSLGTSLQIHSMDAYTNSLGAMLSNPNMTGDDRKAMMQNLQSIYGGYNQQLANIPAFVPGYSSDPNYWSENFIGGMQGGGSAGQGSPSVGGGAGSANGYSPNYPVATVGGG